MIYSCAIRNCRCRALYGPPGTAAILCFKHKSSNSIDMSEAICSAEDCDARPIYYGDDGIWTHCQKHFSGGMKRKYLTRMYYIDEKGKCCEHSETDKRIMFRTNEMAKLKRKKEKNTDEEYQVQLNKINEIVAQNKLAANAIKSAKKQAHIQSKLHLSEFNSALKDRKLFKLTIPEFQTTFEADLTHNLLSMLPVTIWYD